MTVNVVTENSKTIEKNAEEEEGTDKKINKEGITKKKE
jgi:hypothetical protein